MKRSKKPLSSQDSIMRLRMQPACMGTLLGIMLPFAPLASSAYVRTPPDNPVYYTTQINLGAFYGSQSSSYGLMDALMPLWQQPHRMLFLDVRGLEAEQTQGMISLGLGYRWLSDDAEQLRGLYAFYDQEKSQHGNLFHQITLGGEYKRARFSLGGNLYLPLGQQRKEAYQRTQFENLTPYLEVQNDGDYLIATGKSGRYAYNEHVLKGADLELGYTLIPSMGLKLYAGAYYFQSEGVETVMGPKLSFQLNLLPNRFRSTAHKMRLEMEGGVQHDRSRGAQWSMGARLSFHLNRSDDAQDQGMATAMTDFIRRDHRMVLQERARLLSESTHYYSDAQGDAYRVALVGDASTLGDAVANPKVDIIGINGLITLAGHGSVNANTTALVPLLAGQILTTDLFPFTENGVRKNIHIGSNGALQSLGDGHLIGLASDASTTHAVYNLDLTVANPSQYAAITNLTGSLSVNNGAAAYAPTTVSGVTSNAAFITNSTALSLDRIVNNTFNLATAPYAIQHTGTFGGLIQSNSITSDATATPEVLIRVNGALTGSIASNTLSYGAASVDETQTAIALIDVRGALGAEASIEGNVLSNSNSSLTANTDVYGMLVRGDLVAGSRISNNQMTFNMAGGSSLAGIHLGLVGDEAGTLPQLNGLVSSNTLNLSMLSGTLLTGIRNDKISSTVNRLTLSGNTISLTASASTETVQGLQLFGDAFSTGHVLQASITGNTIHASNGDAVIGMVFAWLNNQSSIASNTFNLVDANSYIMGLLQYGNDAGGQVQSFSFKDNTVSISGTAGSFADAVGIYSNEAVQSDITGNNFNLNLNSASTLYGLYMQPYSNAYADFTGSFSHNSLSLQGATERAAGILTAYVTLNGSIAHNNMTVKSNTIATGISQFHTNYAGGASMLESTSISHNNVTLHGTYLVGIETGINGNSLNTGRFESNTITAEPTGAFYFSGINLHNPRESGTQGWALHTNSVNVATTQSGAVLGYLIHSNTPDAIMLGAYRGEVHGNSLNVSGASITTTTGFSFENFVTFNNALSIKDNSLNINLSLPGSSITGFQSVNNGAVGPTFGGNVISGNSFDLTATGTVNWSPALP